MGLAGTVPTPDPLPPIPDPRSAPNPQPPSPITRGGLAGAAAIVMAAFVASRATGLLRDMAVYYQFGTGHELAAYLAAIRIPDFIFQVTADDPFLITDNTLKLSAYMADNGGILWDESKKTMYWTARGPAPQATFWLTKAVASGVPGREARANPTA